MTYPHSCPLCTETYDDRNELRVHLEVEHRKSEVVSCLVDRDAEVTPVSPKRDQPTDEEERPAPSA
ncbi:hypothetical protein [Natrinema sp. 74]|uniref:hypothetical protein n=1 Tax=Natrinema sp. 74 TaxID=3384159 RepID=UPI0038D3EB9D